MQISQEKQELFEWKLRLLLGDITLKKEMDMGEEIGLQTE